MITPLTPINISTAHAQFLVARGFYTSPNALLARAAMLAADNDLTLFLAANAAP